MIPDFETYCLNEKSIKTIKKTIRGVLSRTDRVNFRKILRKNIVYFSFKKKDGTIRRAVGTLISSYLPALRGGSPKPEYQMVYYDMEKKHWRSFRSYSFIKILNVKSEDDYEGVKKIKTVKTVVKPDMEETEMKDVRPEKEEKSKKPDGHGKTYRPGDKIPEKELMRRSTDFRKGTRKNKFTRKSNDAYRKGKLKDVEED